MRRRMVVVGMLLGFAVAAFPLAAESPADLRAKMTARQAEEETAVQKKFREILKNQEQILANQAAILQKFDAVMEELRIIKVRATLRGGS
ncbi:MAG: hypothetical protein HY598_02375 [Candidatus Omnitrophica bacterium]|nr:hypothetical protein [Candidatus Omnitrophota bacterium]